MPQCEVCGIRQLFGVKRLPCGHRICQECFFEHQLQNIYRTASYTCPSCEVELTERTTSSLLSSGRFRRLQRYMARAIRHRDPNIVVCPEPDCNGFGPRTGPTWKCDQCGIEICSSCRLAVHEGIDCEAAIALAASAYPEKERQSLRLIREISKPCPLGHRCVLDPDPISHHCQCGYCGSRFCWICREHLDPGHFNVLTSHCPVAPIQLSFVGNRVLVGSYNLPLTITEAVIVRWHLTTLTVIDLASHKVKLHGGLDHEWIKPGKGKLVVHLRNSNVVSVFAPLGKCPFKVVKPQEIRIRPKTVDPVRLEYDMDADDEAEESRPLPAFARLRKMLMEVSDTPQPQIKMEIPLIISPELSPGALLTPRAIPRRSQTPTRLSYGRTVNRTELQRPAGLPPRPRVGSAPQRMKRVRLTAAKFKPALTPDVRELGLGKSPPSVESSDILSVQWRQRAQRLSKHASGCLCPECLACIAEVGRRGDSVLDEQIELITVGNRPPDPMERADPGTSSAKLPMKARDFFKALMEEEPVLEEAKSPIETETIKPVSVLRIVRSGEPVQLDSDIPEPKIAELTKGIEDENKSDSDSDIESCRSSDSFILSPDPDSTSPLDSILKTSE